MSSRRDRLRYALSFRLALWYGVLFVVSALALVAITYALLAQSLKARDHELIRSTLERYADEYAGGGLSALNRVISTDRVEGRHEQLFVRVLARGSEAIFFNIPSDASDFDVGRLPERHGLDSSWWESLTSPRRRAVLEVASARLPDGTLVQVGKSSDARDELLGHFRSRVELVFVCILTIAVLGATLLNSLGLKPVRDLAATVRTIVQTGKLDSRVTVEQTGDALDELGVLVNGMLDRIQALIASMRGALDNVAHDLRTPLMRLRGVAESALISNDPAAAREALARTLEEVDRVAATLTTLMDISEAETGAMRLTLEPVRLGHVAREAAELYDDLADEKHITLENRVDESIELTADHARLRQVLANLIDNAVKYTPGGGQVVVDATVQGKDVVVEVRDTGPGIPESETERVWERLYRGDASRSERGLGLGLSLVKAIVEAHGGRVGLRSTPGDGSVFVFALPRAPASPSDMHVIPRQR